MSNILAPIIAVLHFLLNVFQAVTHDWGAAIILLTITVRAALFFTSLRNARQQIIQSRMAPKLKELREKYAKDAQKMTEETLKLYQTYGMKPFALLLTAVIQFPIFMGLYRVFALHGTTMTTVLLPWIETLGHADPYHIIPLLCAALQFSGFLIPLTNEAAVTTTSNIKIRLLLPFIFTIGFSFVLWHAPSALALYWTTSALFALAERGFYRTSSGRALLLRGIPIE